jgi:hypothetical protein
MSTGLNKTLRSEEGSMIVMALLVLVILTLIGASITNTTKVEIQISGNETFHKMAFHLADSGTMVTPKVISACMDSASEENIPGVTYLGTSGTFYRELMGYAPHDADHDLRFPLSGYSVDVDVRRIAQVNLAGRGAEFAAGAEGVGVGSSGGVAILYEVDAQAPGPNEALSNVSAIYRKIVGLAGGL